MDEAGGALVASLHMNRRAIKIVVALAVGGAGGTLLAAVALAHPEVSIEIEGSGPGWCLIDRAANSGEQRATSATAYSYTEGCTGFKVKDPGKLRSKDNLLKDGGSSYYQCREGGWGYNFSPTYATETQTFYGGTPCGGGRYKTRGLTGLQHNGDWKSGLVDSPPHMWP